MSNPSASADALPTLHYKLVLLGDASVGKSCLVIRFARGHFYEYQEPTIGAAFMTQTVSLRDAVIKFEIWDTAGQERYRSLAPMYYRGASAAIVVYDITSADSFEGAKTWIQELRNINNASQLVIALVGNKQDLDARRVVSTEQAASYAREQGVQFMETSAKSGYNVMELFHEIALRVPRKQGDSSPNSGGAGKSTKAISISGANESPKAAGFLTKCCSR